MRKKRNGKKEGRKRNIFNCRDGFFSTALAIYFPCSLHCICFLPSVSTEPWTSGGLEGERESCGQFNYVLGLFPPPIDHALKKRDLHSKDNCQGNACFNG